MSKLIATLVASMFAVAAYAQTGGVPPTVPAAGTNTKMEMKKDDAMMKKDDAMMKKDDKMDMSSDKKATRKAKSSARKMKRVEKVGDKPVN